MVDEHHSHDESGHHPAHPTSTDRVFGVTPFGCAVIIAVPTLIIVGLVMFAVFSDSPVERLARGNPAELRSRGPIYVVSDEEFPKTLLELKSAKVAYDTLLGAGKAFKVENATRVRVIDIRVTFVRVRIQSGAHRGKVGWVSEDWIQPVSRP